MCESRDLNVSLFCKEVDSVVIPKRLLETLPSKLPYTILSEGQLAPKTCSCNIDCALLIVNNTISMQNHIHFDSYFTLWQAQSLNSHIAYKKMKGALCNIP